MISDRPAAGSDIEARPRPRVYFDRVRAFPWSGVEGPALHAATCVVVVAAVAATLFHAWYAIASGCYVNYVSGVWLALARDLSHGTFYRDLVGDAGYGGTRYFPLFFSLIALLLRAGVAPLAAGQAVSVGSAVLLAIGLIFLLSRVVRVAPAMVALLTTFALAPYFLQQTVFAIRCDILAVALNVCGLAAVFRPHRERVTAWLAVAALFFTLALATKVTSVYGVATALITLALARRWRQAAWLLLLTGTGFAVCLVSVDWLSSGRAFESFRVCALAGSTLAGTVRNAFSASMRLAPVGGSRTLTAVLATATLAWGLQLRAGWRQMPTVLFAVTCAMTMLVLGSPGTVPVNQVADVHVASVVVIGACLRDRARIRTAAVALLLALMLVAAYQDVGRVTRQRLGVLAHTLPAERRELLAIIGSEPVLAECPEFPVMAGRTPYVLDPFALRLLLMQRPDALAALEHRVDAHAFAHVLLLEDPESPRGRGWYEYEHLGWPLVATVLRNYHHQTTVAGVRVYTPNP
jgi:hypothetical protein